MQPWLLIVDKAHHSRYQLSPLPAKMDASSSRLSPSQPWSSSAVNNAVTFYPGHARTRWISSAPSSPPPLAQLWPCWSLHQTRPVILVPLLGLGCRQIIVILIARLQVHTYLQLSTHRAFLNHDASLSSQSPLKLTVAHMLGSTCSTRRRPDHGNRL